MLSGDVTRSPSCRVNVLHSVDQAGRRSRSGELGCSSNECHEKGSLGKHVDVRVEVVIPIRVVCGVRRLKARRPIL